jgi:hypothetical protein
MDRRERQEQLRKDAETVREIKRDWPDWKRSCSLGPVPRSPDMALVRAKAKAGTDS